MDYEYDYLGSISDKFRYIFDLFEIGINIEYRDGNFVFAPDDFSNIMDLLKVSKEDIKKREINKIEGNNKRKLLESLIDSVIDYVEEQGYKDIETKYIRR
jgi:hypothetical protein